MAKPRIAILGGGAGAVTAALELSKPGWENHYESISLYQQGWRLGGKGACGRGPRPSHRGARAAPLVRLLRERVPAPRSLPPGARPARRQCETAPLGPGVQERRGKLQPAGAARGRRLRRLRVEPVGGGLLRRRRRPSLAGARSARPGRAPGPVDGRLLRGALPAAGGRPCMVPRRVRPGAGEDPPGRRGGSREASRSSTTRSTSRWGPLGGDVRAALDAAANLLDALVEEAFDQPAVLGALGIVVRAVDLAGDFLRRRFDEEARASPSFGALLRRRSDGGDRPRARSRTA